MLALLLACSGDPPPPPDAAAVTWGARTVADGLVGHDARLDALEAARPPEVSAAAVAALDERLSRIEQTLLQGQAAQTDAARPTAGYPTGPGSSATLSLEARLTRIEDKVFAVDMGEPGSGLFEIPKTPGKGGRGGKGGGNGPPGGPPGGSPNGPGSGAGNGPPGPPPNGGQAGPGGPPPG